MNIPNNPGGDNKPLATLIPSESVSSRPLGVRSQILRQADYDRTGQIEYRINEFGFRGEDVSKEPLRRLFVFGCSHTFGTGLAENEIWCEHFRLSYASLIGVPPSQVNLLNFGCGGSSNAEIARTCLVQCASIRPDLAIVMFTDQSRLERIHGDRVVSLGPWSVEHGTDEIRPIAADLYRNHNDETAALDTVKNALLCQLFFQAHKIDYILAGFGCEPNGMSEPVKQLYRLFDQKRVVWVAPAIDRYVKNEGVPESVWFEKAVDGLHQGPLYHQLAGRAVFERYKMTLAKNAEAPSTEIPSA